MTKKISGVFGENIRTNKFIRFKGRESDDGRYRIDSYTVKTQSGSGDGIVYTRLADAIVATEPYGNAARKFIVLDRGRAMIAYKPNGTFVQSFSYYDGSGSDRMPAIRRARRLAETMERPISPEEIETNRLAYIASTKKLKVDAVAKNAARELEVRARKKELARQTRHLSKMEGSW